MKQDDGGPAFPYVLSGDPGYLDTETGETHPTQDDVHYSGMTLRDYFAGQALAGLSMSDSRTVDVDAEIAYEAADAMLTARESKSVTP